MNIKNDTITVRMTDGVEIEITPESILEASKVLYAGDYKFETPEMLAKEIVLAGIKMARLANSQRQKKVDA